MLKIPLVNAVLGLDRCLYVFLGMLRSEKRVYDYGRNLEPLCTK